MKDTLKKNIVLPMLALVALAGVGTGVLSYARASNADTVATTSTSIAQPDQGRGPGVVGTVASVSGTTMTVTGKDGSTYTVDASNTTFHKSVSGAEPTTVAIGDIAVGDTIGIRGTVSGTSVTATDVMDGLLDHGGPGGHGGGGRGPGVTGTVSAISGNTITITNTDGTTYTINAANAEVSKMQTLSVSDIAVGDKIGVEGTVSGTSVTANHIMDGVPTAPLQAASASAQVSATSAQ